MSLNTYPNNPFPPSTEQMHRGDNEELQAQIDAIKNSATIDSFGDVETALATKTDNDVIAPEFDAEAGVYSVGDLVMHEGKLYEFTTAHETAGVWNPEEVTEKTVADEVDTLKSGLTNVNNNIAHLRATSSATGTDSDKLTEIKSAYNALSSDEKNRAFIVHGGAKYNIAVFTWGQFVLHYYYNSKLYISILDVSGGHNDEMTITDNGAVAVINKDTTSDSNVFELYA